VVNSIMNAAGPQKIPRETIEERPRHEQHAVRQFHRDLPDVVAVIREGLAGPVVEGSKIDLSPP
jgi:hypothetical protein